MPTFLSLTIEAPTAISKAVVGSFSGPKVQEVVAAQGTTLALYRISAEGEISLANSVNAFGLVRELAPFRLTGLQRDYLAVTSDCGRIVILKFEIANGGWVKIHQETFGKTGVRRIVPGQYLCADPRGRSLVLGAVEKQKFLYILNRDNQNRLQISSPLECHSSNQITFSMCSLDVGFENPLFVSLESTIRDDIENESGGSKARSVKDIVFYELDLGLNHVVKKATIPVDPTASCLIPIPAGANFQDGPGGVLVCSADHITFKRPDHPDVKCMFPQRLYELTGRGDAPPQAESGIIDGVISWACHKMKDFYLILVQNSSGDLFRVDYKFKGPNLLDLEIGYFDTIPLATSLCILKSGFLFAACECTDHTLFQFIGIDKSVTMTSQMDFADGALPFRPTVLRNLSAIGKWANRAPLTHMKVVDCIRLTQCPQLYAFKGCGPNSKLSIMTLGLAVTEVAASEVPGKPTAVFTLREKITDSYHSILILSFAASTLVMKVTDSIEEMTDTQCVTDRATLHAALMADSSILQITEDGWSLLQRVDEDTNQRRVSQWRAPAGKRVICAASNGTQVLLALNGGVISYFEMQLHAGSRLLEEIDSKDIGMDLTAVALMNTLGTDFQSVNFGVVAGVDRVIRSLVLQGDRPMWNQISQHQLPTDAHAESIVLSKATTSTELVLNVGLSTGVLLRLPVSLNTGAIGASKRRKFLGTTPVKVAAVELCGPQGEAVQGITALSSKPWLGYGGINDLEPLVSGPINAIAGLNTEHAAWGYVAVVGNYMKIISVEPNPNNSIFSSVDVPLQFTPRKASIFPPPPTIHEKQNALLKGTPVVLLPPSPQRPWLIACIESDHNTFDLATRNQIQEALSQVELPHQPRPEKEENAAGGGDTGEEEEEEEPQVDIFDPPVEQVGTFRAGDGKWGGCLRLISPTEGILQTIPFGADEAPVSICVCQFVEYPDHPALVVGTVTGLNLKNRKCIRGGIKTFIYVANGELQMLHETPLEDIPYALCAWQNRLLAGVGNRLRIYTLGKKRLLKKCEYKNLPLGVSWIEAHNNYFFIADIREGFHVLLYDPMENCMRVEADQITPRWVTDGELLDPFTLAGFDKFDNFFAVRVPLSVIKNTQSTLSAIDTAPITTKSDLAYLTGKNEKLDRLCEFHLGDIGTSLAKCQLSFGGSEILLYSTILGAIGAMVPVQTQSEVDVLSHLEMLMRNEDVSIIGRDHMFFRSAVFPVKNVIDGDLLLSFQNLQSDRQKWIAQQMDRQPAEIVRMLEDCRARVF